MKYLHPCRGNNFSRFYEMEKTYTSQDSVKADVHIYWVNDNAARIDVFFCVCGIVWCILPKRGLVYARWTLFTTNDCVCGRDLTVRLLPSLASEYYIEWNEV
jgi:hypothetical protein